MADFKWRGQAIEIKCPEPPACDVEPCRKMHFTWSEYCEIQNCRLTKMGITLGGTGRHRAHEALT